MSNGTFNVAKGREAEYGALPGASDSIILVLLRAVEADSLLKQRTTLANVFATNTVANFTNYPAAHITLTSSFVVDHTAGGPILDATDQTPAIAVAGGATNNTIVKALVCYKSATGAADSAIVPMFYFDAAFTTSGLALNVAVSDTGLWRDTS